MIVVPEAENRFVLKTETEAEEYLIRRFIMNWQEGNAELLMSTLIENRRAVLRISNAPMRLLPAGKSNLELKIKKYFKDL
ncbi:MAG: hypothetical protein ABII13_05675 [Patescibacteria group bacterium]